MKDTDTWIMVLAVLAALSLGVVLGHAWERERIVKACETQRVFVYDTGAVELLYLCRRSHS